jgi:hypothetical protein
MYDQIRDLPLLIREKIYGYISYARIMSKLQEDIQSFRNIIKCLQKYNSVGDQDPNQTWSSDIDTPVECINPYFVDGRPALANKCMMYNWCDTKKPTNREEIINQGMEEECVIFFHLVESKKSKSGIPTFQSMKFWGGTCDFMYPEFTYDPDLKIWSADSFGGEMYFEWTTPFIFQDTLKDIRSDLHDQVIEKLGKHLRVDEKSLKEWANQYN